MTSSARGSDKSAEVLKAVDPAATSGKAVSDARGEHSDGKTDVSRETWSSVTMDTPIGAEAERAVQIIHGAKGQQLPRPQHQRVFTIANQKGGVGKTTTAINLATALAAIGERVLIVDLDPQGNASTGLGIQRRDRRLSSYELMVGSHGIDEIVQETVVPNLSIVPSTMDLLGIEMEIAQASDRIFRLRKALASPAALSYSYVLVDCPPSFNLLTMNAMAAAHSVLVPLQCEFFALEGLSQLLETVDQVRRSVNPTLDIQGIVLTMFDSRNNLAQQVVSDVRTHLGEKVYHTLIPRNVRVSEAPSYGKPAILYDLKCAGSQAYLQLASEVIQRERQRKAA